MTGLPRLVELCAPRSEPEVAVLRSILDDAGIPYHVHNDTFGSMVAGPLIAHYNGKRILVPEAGIDEARALLADLDRQAASRSRPAPARRYALGDKVRMVCEFLIFGWFMPGRKPPPPSNLRLVKGAGVRPTDPSPAGSRPRGAAIET